VGDLRTKSRSSGLPFTKKKVQEAKSRVKIDAKLGGPVTLDYRIKSTFTEARTKEGVSNG